MTPAAYAALQKKKWESETDDYVNVHSVVAKFTGNVSVTDPHGNKVMDQVPDSIISLKKFKAEDHAYSTTIPMLGRLKGPLTGGNQKMESNEIKLPIFNKTVYYNVERTAVAVGDESVEGDVVKWTGVGNMAVTALKARLVETEDHRFHKSILEADPMLSESAFWDGSSIPAPVTKKIHPKIFVNSKNQATWNDTYATYEGTINTAADALTTSNIFDQTAIENIIFLAGRTRIKPIQDTKLNFKYLALPSDVAYEQLTSGASNSFMQGFKDAGERAKDNIGLTAEVGVYRGLLIMKDTRASLFNIAATSGSKFEYVDPNSDNQVLARIAPDSAVGTCELTPVLGAGAIGKVVAGELKLKQKFFDYDFSEGLCSMTKFGYNRMEYQGSDTTAEPTQCRSFIYMTASKDAIAAS